MTVVVVNVFESLVVGVVFVDYIVHFVAVVVYACVVACNVVVAAPAAIVAPTV